jgi:hypothetical protein
MTHPNGAVLCKLSVMRISTFAYSSLVNFTPPPPPPEIDTLSPRHLKRYFFPSFIPECYFTTSYKLYTVRKRRLSIWQVWSGTEKTDPPGTEKGSVIHTGEPPYFYFARIQYKA